MKNHTRLLAFVAALAALTLPLSAQSVSRSYSFSVSASAGAVSPTFPNVGQSAHQFYACVVLPSGASQVTSSMELEESADGVNYIAISPLTATITSSPAVPGQTPCVTLTANGYYTYVRLNVVSLTITGGSATSTTLNGTYSGSVGSNPVGGEVRSSSAAQKVSQVPAASSFISSTLKSATTTVFAAPGSGSASGFIYGALISNPNASQVVYVQLGSGSTVSSSPSAVIPVAGSAVVYVTFPAPVYVQNNLNIACSTLPGGAADPTTACFVDLLYTEVTGVNSNVDSTGGVHQTDNGVGTIPHEEWR